MTPNRQLALIRHLCGLGLPPQTLAPSLLPVLRRLIPSHSAAVFWVDERMEMTDLYAERLLSPEAMARYYDKHYKNRISGFPAAFGARAAAPDPVSIRKVIDAERASDYFREILAKLDAYQILYGVLRGASGPIGQISFYRGERDAAFSQTDQAMLRGLLRYLAVGLQPQRSCSHPVSLAQVIEEWLGIITPDGATVSAPPPWSRLVRLLAMKTVDPRRAREQERVVAEFLRQVCSRFKKSDADGANDLVDLEYESPWGRFRVRAYRLPNSQPGRSDNIGLLIGRFEPRALALARGAGASRLSPQQREVALLLAERKSNQEIARSLALTFNTASYHVKQVFARLQVHSREEVEGVLLRLAREAAGDPRSDMEPHAAPAGSP
ncbi:MAG TPA: helix-turn-helix transcriptional regulator [Casimicrobiaceae bacterium]|jgi:DNA-binding CsgD family transcriptional regulator